MRATFPAHLISLILSLQWHLMKNRNNEVRWISGSHDGDYDEALSSGVPLSLQLVSCLFCLLFDLEDRGSAFLWNVGEFPQHYMASYFARQYASYEVHYHVFFSKFVISSVFNSSRPAMFSPQFSNTLNQIFFTCNIQCLHPYRITDTISASHISFKFLDRIILVCIMLYITI
jgi:hypothetical protein